MVDIALALALVVIAYLVGAIPFGLLIGWARGVDVRRLGSRNIGATNVGRVVGWKWGKICLVLDILKGFVPAAAAGALLDPSTRPKAMLTWWLAIGLAAVLGHVFPVYLGFRGGKGVATTIGVALGIYPYYTVAITAALAAYLVVRLATGRVSAGSLTLAIVFPVALYVYLLWQKRPLAEYWPLLACASLLGILILVRHYGNVRRLLRGEEMRPPTRHGAEELPPRATQRP